MPDVACPVLQFHGTDDEFVPVEHGRELFDAAPEHSTSGVEKRFVVIEGGAHNNVPVSLMADELSEFLRAVRRSPESTAETPADAP